MTQEELESLKEGDTIWYSKILLATSGRVCENKFFKISYINKRGSCYEMSIVKEKVGHGSESLHINSYELRKYGFLTEEEAIDFWNSHILQKKDEITFKYEEINKLLDKKLIKK